MADEYSVGIDLGTTYSCIAYMDDDGSPAVDKNFEQEETTPSVILFNENGEIIVGSPAKDMALMYPPDRIVTSIKRRMGTDYSVDIDGQKYTPVTLSATILRKMINDFNDNHGCDLRKAVITCPAYFGQEERDATKLAGTVAGLEDVTIINEPTAAAISFGFGSPGGGSRRILVYDLGGGTFDVTVLEIDGRSFTAVATDGERLLGGKDWDEALTRVIVSKIAEQSGLDEGEIEADEDVRQSLAIDSETLKKRLSTAESTKGTITVGGQKIIYTVTRAEFDATTKPLLETTLDIVDRVLQSKGLGAADLDAVLLVGGSSRMPQVRIGIENRFPGAKIEVYDPDQSVAKGAALFCRSNSAVQEAVATAASAAVGTEITMANAAAVAAENDIALPEDVLSVHNVLSKSFGIKASDERGNEHISNIIFRNEVLPISEVKTYYPMEDGQLTIKVEIFEDAAENNEEGRKIDVVDGTPVGEFEMGLPENVTRDSPVVVTFTASDEGILTASVECMDIRTDYQLQNKILMSASEIGAAQGLMDRVN
ncbi:Hsp70 family protein [Methanomassiliicoccaceae archaeon COG_1]|nr:Hsp70 family protein [Methanomassiliicoccaceae archaeon COG_1]